MASSQSYSNHRRIVPLYHLVAAPLLILNFGWAFARLSHGWSMDALVNLLTAFALILVLLYARTFALRVQDRVIRLEMRLRMADVLPSDLNARASALTMRQLIALRFASDEELPDVVDRVLRDQVTDATAIKKMITQWQADHHRA
jgi:hypothetical protein